MKECLEIIFSSFWTFLGTSILVSLIGFSGALSFYWLTRYKELKEEERAQRFNYLMEELKNRSNLN